jgi:hypothetical protein
MLLKSPGFKTRPSEYCSSSPLWPLLIQGHRKTSFLDLLSMKIVTIKVDPRYATTLHRLTWPLVLYQCGLERDLSLFDSGDKTEVGEKGITLRFVSLVLLKVDYVSNSKI